MIDDAQAAVRKLPVWGITDTQKVTHRRKAKYNIAIHRRVTWLESMPWGWLENYRMLHIWRVYPEQGGSKCE